jgi:hypothetical protein
VVSWLDDKTIELWDLPTEIVVNTFTRQSQIFVFPGVEESWWQGT